MITIDNTYSNPRLVNAAGGILVTQPSGKDLYIDQSHPQYSQVADGSLLGAVTEQLLDSVTLDDLKNQKHANLSLSAQKKIISGSTSSALGSEHFYPSDIPAQSNIQALVLAGNDSTFMCRDNNGVWARRLHTIAQLQQLLSDGVTFIQSVLNDLDVRRAAVEAATESEELDAISEIF